MDSQTSCCLPSWESSLLLLVNSRKLACSLVDFDSLSCGHRKIHSSWCWSSPRMAIGCDACLWGGTSLRRSSLASSQNSASTCVVQASPRLRHLSSTFECQFTTLKASYTALICSWQTTLAWLTDFGCFCDYDSLFCFDLRIKQLYTWVDVCH